MSPPASPFFPTPDALAAGTAHGDEAHYRTLVDYLPEPLLVMQDDQIVFANPAAARLLGLPAPTAMLGLPLSGLVAPGYHHLCEQCKQATFSGTPRSAPVSMKLRRADASLVEVEPLTFAFHYQERPAILAVLRDLTERRRVEQAAERFRIALDSSPDMVCLIDPERMRFLDVNDSACTRLGYTREELLDLGPQDIKPHFNKAMLHRHFAEVLAGRHEAELLQTPHQRKDGSLFPVEIRLRPFASGGQSLIVAVARDITERKRAEAALKESELRFRLLFEKSPIGIALADQDCHLIQANQALCDMLGYPAEELLGKTFIEITHPEDIASNLNLYGQARAGIIRDYALRKRYLRKDGGVLWANLTSTLIRDPAGTLLYSLGMVEDITRQINAEQERLAHEARQRDALVREVHHRIKNSLQGVVGLLRQHSTDHPETLAPIEAAIAQINTIAVVHGLQSRLPQNDLRLRELLREVCSAAAALAMTPRLPVLDDALPGDVLLDSNAAVTLALILNELVHNALKHGIHTGDSEVVITLCSDGDQVALRIDNPGEPLPQGFDLTNGHGCGTGLNLVRTLLPRRGARLNMSWRDGVVSARLTLSPPVVTPPCPPGQAPKHP